MQVQSTLAKRCQQPFTKKSSFLQKRRNLFKKVIDLAKQYDQDVFICIRDKKKEKVVQYSSDIKNFGISQVSSHIQKQIEIKVQRLESVFEKPITTEVASAEPNESTIESSEPSREIVKKVSDFLNLCQGGEATANCAMQSLTTCADSRITSLVAEPQDFSEPLAPSTLFFPVESSVTKMANLLNNSEKVEKEEYLLELTPKKNLFSSRQLEDSDYCLRYQSRCSDKIDFAQKYLFKKTDDDFEKVSEHSEENSDSEDEDSLYFSEASEQCEDIFTCADWDQQNKRKAKMEIKEQTCAAQTQQQFDIDSIMMGSNNPKKPIMAIRIPQKKLKLSDEESSQIFDHQDCLSPLGAFCSIQDA